MIRAISVITFILWVPLALFAGYGLAWELLPLIHGRDVLIELVVLTSGLAAMLFAGVALARNTRSAAARALIAAVPGAISAVLLACTLLMSTTTLDPILVGWLFLTDLLLTIMLPGAWFIVWRSSDRGDDQA